MALTNVAPIGRVPRDTFGVRLAMIRAEAGWNVSQAATACGLAAASWRKWERGENEPRDLLGVAAAIAGRTGYSQEWLVSGGPLDHRPRKSSYWNPSKALVDARDQAGKYAEDAERDVREAIFDVKVSFEDIERIHATVEELESTRDLMILFALAVLYGLEPEELGASTAEKLHRLVQEHPDQTNLIRRKAEQIRSR